MYRNIDLSDVLCYGPSILGLRILTFPDGSQVGITGLDEVMENLHRQGKPADSITAFEIIERLKVQNQFTSTAQPIYEELFLLAYKSFLEMKLHSKEKEKNTMSNQENNQNDKKNSFFNLFKGDKKAGSKGDCCNMKIVPKEQPAKETSKGGCCNIKIVPKEQVTENKDIQS